MFQALGGQTGRTRTRWEIIENPAKKKRVTDVGFTEQIEKQDSESIKKNMERKATLCKDAVTVQGVKESMRRSQEGTANSG